MAAPLAGAAAEPSPFIESGARTKKFSEKNFMCGKNILFCKLFDNYVSENEIIEN